MFPELFLLLQFYLAFDLNIISDEPLHPIVEAALSEDIVELDPQENAAVYLMGIVAAEEDDIFEVGKQRFKAHSEVSINPKDRFKEVYPKEKWPLEIAEPFCIPKVLHDPSDKSEQVSCLQQLEMSCNDRLAIVNTYSFLIDNFRQVISKKLIAFPESSTTIQFDMLQHFRKANALDNLKLIYQSECQKNDANRSISIFIDSADKIEHFRSMLTQTTDLIHKVGLLLLINDQYIWHTYHTRKYRDNSLDTANIFSIRSQQERSFRKVFSKVIREQKALTDFAMTTESIGKNADLLRFLFFRENLTLNEVSENYIYLIEESERLLGDFESIRVYDPPLVQFKWWRIGNLLGEMLNYIGKPRFISLVDDFNALDMTIRLSDIAINYTDLIENQSLEKLPLDKRNPYDQSLPYLDESGEWLCFKAPEQTSGLERCIYLN